MHGSCLFRTAARPSLLPLILMMMVCLHAGCAPQSNPSIDSAIRDYDAARYKDAYDAAWLARRGSTGVDRQKAAYVAGISAMKMDRPVTARELLQEASTSSDRRLAGTASVTLGTLLLEDGEPLSAARAFDRASERLSGSDSIKARQAAAAAYKTAGRNDIAQARLSGTPAPTASGTGAFTIQGGAFHDEARATVSARELSDAARRTSLGTARVVPAMVNGKAGFLVQIGSYANRTDAESMRRLLGVSGTFIARIGGPSSR